MLNAALIVCLIVAAQEKGRGRLELEPGDLQPGLVAEYRSLVEKDASRSPRRAEAGVLPRPVQPAPAHPAGAVRG